MARFGRNEQLVIVGAAVAFVSYLLGVVFDHWEITLAAGTVLVASAIAFALTFMAAAPSIAGVASASIVRIAAAFAGAFALIHFGDLVSDFSQESLLSNLLTLAHVAGAAILAYGAWAVSGGSVLADARGVLGAMRMEMSDRFVYVGAVGVIIGWFLIMAIADIYNFNTIASATVFLATLVLVVRWLERNPDAGKLPLPAPWTLVGLGAVTVLVGLVWFVQIIGRTISESLASPLAWIVLVLYLLALASLAAGAFLGIGGKATAPAA